LDTLLAGLHDQRVGSAYSGCLHMLRSMQRQKKAFKMQTLGMWPTSSGAGAVVRGGEVPAHAEVPKAECAISGQKYVAGLDVAVQQVVSVQVSHCRCYLHGNVLLKDHAAANLRLSG
jgi:hypothetical protein